MRAAIYARYSSDLQNPRSIDDQVALATARADREGWSVVKVYSDAALSGTTLKTRHGLLTMLADAKARKFDVVLTESLDRIARDQEHIFRVSKRLSYAGVQLVTLADGPVDDLHIGVKGMMSALYVKDLGQKVRRGHIGRVNAGRGTCGPVYGYDITSTLEERGTRRINGAEAAIVRRIFREYSEGRSPRAIVKQLNAEGVRPRRASAWSVGAINGCPRRRFGILHTEMYRGVMVYNRMRRVRDPETERIVQRENPPSEWVRCEVPELRIVDEEMWLAVRREWQRRSIGPMQKQRRPRHVLSGLVHCGTCGGIYRVITRGYWGCAARRVQGTCNNGRLIHAGELERRVLRALQDRLLAPECVTAAVEAYRQERRRSAQEARQRTSALRNELAEAERKIKNWERVIEAGEASAEPLKAAARYNALIADRDRIAALLAGVDKPVVVELHPQAAERYRAIVENLAAVLSDCGEHCAGAITAVRNIIERVIVRPAPGRKPIDLEIRGTLNILLAPADASDRTAITVSGAS